MFKAYSRFINKRKAKEKVMRIIDATFTLLGIILMLVIFLVATPFILLDRLLSGDWK